MFRPLHILPENQTRRIKSFQNVCGYIFGSGFASESFCNRSSLNAKSSTPRSSRICASRRAPRTGMMCDACWRTQLNLFWCEARQQRT